MAGTKELKELLTFGVALGESFGDALADGQFDWTDLVEFVDVVRTSVDAFNGLGEIPGELADLSEVEHAELVAYVKEEFDIPQDHVEEFVEDAFDTALSIVRLVSRWFVSDQDDGEAA